MKLAIRGVPKTVRSPLWIYEVALAAIPSRPKQPAPIVEVTVRCEVGRDEPLARTVTITLEAPGVITPMTSTTRARIRPGHHAEATFRWAVPIRAVPPPYVLTLAAGATYRSAGSPGRTTTSVTTRVDPPPAPSGEVYVSDLPFDYVTNGYGTVQRDHAANGYGPDDGLPMILGGIAYDKGIGVNSVADVGVFLDGRYREFRATIGVDDGAGPNASVTFRVIGDGSQLYASGAFRRSMPPESIVVDIRGVRQLDLIVDDAGNGHGDDHGDWADARLR
ncbi:NPCBM/NEW2 domain-containing protein [Microlunatus soli]|uniref:NPCBM/NEW2 domain-containing protein n=1 Tax=Microlunatus soli TaxID=630515 RepID=A0A1H1QM03_9ACTN|nr:NPCBM/NEW2 domain-containing protein [Microlunatus soli]SDS24373.1 NPCBM/NEW2 domain-containing protein [Microlunatus soli]